MKEEFFALKILSVFDKVLHNNFIYIVMSYYSKSQIDKLLKSKNHYETLGLHASASQKQIKQAFKQRALRYHPDKTSIPQAKELFGKVASAYEKLSDSEEKARYDASLSRQKSAPFSASSFKKEESSHQKYKSYEKQQFKKNNFSSFRQQNKQKYDKYFKPPPKPHHFPKRPQENQREEDPSYAQPQQKKSKYKFRTIKSNPNYGTVLITLLCFFLFWSFVPSFSTQPRYQFARVGPYSYEMKTGRYKVKYWMKEQDVNKTQISEAKLQQNYIRLLQNTCENAMKMKEKIQMMKTSDPLNKKIWIQKQKRVDYKACKRLLKLLKKYPEIKLTKFPKLNIP